MNSVRTTSFAGAAPMRQPHAMPPVQSAPEPVRPPRAALAARCAAAVALALCLPGLAVAATPGACTNRMLKGTYVFSATGFTRAPGTGPGTPWVPKAIVEILQFNGDGTLQTPVVTVANPFGDTGAVLQPPSGAPGEYTVNPDCTGTVHFFDAANVTFAIHVEPFATAIHMIQTNPSNNVFEGLARRSW